VDAPGATWRNVMADTKGHVWRIFLFSLVASLPLIVLILAFGALVGFRPPTGSWIDSGLFILFNTVLGVVALTLFIVVASRLYMWIGNRAKRP
jgi:hypothetical protein